MLLQIYYSLHTVMGDDQSLLMDNQFLAGICYKNSELSGYFRDSSGLKILSDIKISEQSISFVVNDTGSSNYFLFIFMKEKSGKWIAKNKEGQIITRCVIKPSNEDEYIDLFIDNK